MNVGEICSRNVATVRPDDELLSAARLMRERHVGYLVVVEPGVDEKLWRPVGVLTDRDLVVSVMARGIEPRGLRVTDVMTRDPLRVTLRDSVAHALYEMRRIGVRRLPITGDLGDLVGVISLDDIVKVLAAQVQDIAGSIQTEQMIEKELRPG
ncbi:MAG TPA: CBS domain-containing protein [Steroidobacteraceae bacterium]|nr:CBS domain-containing protein [Steroidobacteraceae bacterium]